MKQYGKNPRRISTEQLKKLEKNIKDLGDLSGIVHDIGTDEIIAGNQRSKVIDIDTCKVELTFENKKPDKQGTIAQGFLITKGKTKMNYRQVKWNEKQRQIANISANKMGGEFDLELLEANFDIDVLELGGYDPNELNSGDDFKPNTNPEQSNNNVSVEDIEKKQAELDQKFQDEKKKIDVICPECTNEFQIDAK